MNNTRGLSVDFLLLPQLIKDATHWVRQREKNRRANGKMGKWVNGGVRSRRQEQRGKQRERRRQVERDRLFLDFLGELSSVNDEMPGECQCENEKWGVGEEF